MKFLDYPRFISAVVVAFAIASSITFLMLFRIDSTTPFSLGGAIGLAVEAVFNTGHLEITGNDRSWFAAKMPFLPYAYAALWSATESVWAMILIKNIALSAMLLVTLFTFAKYFNLTNRQLSLCIILIFSIPFNLFTMMTLSYEEAILSFLVPVTLALVLMSPGIRALLGLSVLVSLIYLTKSSVVLFCLWISLCAIVTAVGVSWPLRLLPLVVLIVSALAWATHIENETDRFAIGSHASSNNGKNFYKGNNPYFASTYPDTHLDDLPSGAWADPPPEFKDEWTSHDHYLQLGQEFIRENPNQVLQNTLTKLTTVFLSIQDFDFNRNRWEKVISHNSGMLINRVFLIGALILALVWVIVGGLRKQYEHAFIGLVFLGAVLSFAAPLIVGFGYQRHMVPIFLSSFFFVALASGTRWRNNKTTLPQLD